MSFISDLTRLSNEAYRKQLKMREKEVDYSKIKFNVTSLAVFKNKRSRYNKFYSFETCDLCNKQGVKFEVIKYSGLFDLNLIRQAVPFREYIKLKETFMFSGHHPIRLYVLFYTCSEDCNSMLLLRQMGN